MCITTWLLRFSSAGITYIIGTPWELLVTCSAWDARLQSAWIVTDSCVAELFTVLFRWCMHDDVSLSVDSSVFEIGLKCDIRSRLKPILSCLVHHPSLQNNRWEFIRTVREYLLLLNILLSITRDVTSTTWLRLLAKQSTCNMQHTKMNISEELHIFHYLFQWVETNCSYHKNALAKQDE